MARSQATSRRRTERPATLIRPRRQGFGPLTPAMAALLVEAHVPPCARRRDANKDGALQ